MLLYIKHEQKLHTIKRGLASFKYRGLGALARSKSYVKRDCASSKSKSWRAPNPSYLIWQKCCTMSALYTLLHPKPRSLCFPIQSHDTRLCKTLFCVTQHDTRCLSSIWMSINMNFYVQFEPLYILFCLCRIRTKYYIKPSRSENSKFNLCSSVEVEHTGTYKHTRSRTKHRFLFRILLPSQVVS